MEHTYGSIITVFPDGQVAYNNPNALPEDASVPELIVAARKLVNQWSGDMSYALDTLAKLDTNDPDGRFTGALDLEKVGVLGHSTGAGATIQFCATDPRCKAGMPMDAYMDPVSEEVLNQGVSQPFLFLFSERWSSQRNDAIFSRLYSHITQPDRVLTIQGTDHYDFSDLPMLSPLAPQLGLKGPLNGARVLRIIDDYTLAFFDHYLKDKPTELLAGPSPQYPEVIYTH
jgi:pimeloyl-ACP methyl ester carboxylesterase